EMQREIPTVEKYVLMDERGPEPSAVPRPALDYEVLLDDASERVDHFERDEHAAAGLCYTSGTTGEPKGVLYSHRSTYLHTLACLFADGIAMRERDVCMPAVPMFHANAW